MKKLMYLFVAAIMFAFTACGGGETATEEAAEETIETVVETAVEEVAEAIGCQVEGGACLEDHSCCAPKSEATCCCGDETCDGSCHGDEADAEEAHTHE
jgi:hypothetical protein